MALVEHCAPVRHFSASHASRYIAREKTASALVSCDASFGLICVIPNFAATVSM
jgi:hypothetical protein